ncbi:MAG: YHS domain-containing protein [Phycisphaerales bacterium]|nr:YHS domain-containing protein [Phycisphaerales bacterium]
MGEWDDLDRQIGERVAAAEAKQREHQDHIRQRMEEIEQRQSRLGIVAQHLSSAIIRPRVERLAQHFENAEVLDAAQCGVGRCVCSFAHTERFPATVTLELFVCSDDRMSSALVCYKLEIRPVFIQFEGRDQLAVPLDAVDDARVALWVDQKLITFVDTYLRLLEVEQYQTDNVVVDPVCGMRINKNTAAGEVERRGHKFYFCINECREKFLKEPERWISERTTEFFTGQSPDR